MLERKDSPVILLIQKMRQPLDYLCSLRNAGSKFGIERMQYFCDRLQNPQLSYPTIHVAGTNGKGSVCTMLDQIYRKNGYKVGLFTSPHLLELGERIRINGKNLPFQEIENWVEKLMPILQVSTHRKSSTHPTFFELMTAIAFLEFQKQKVEVGIFETGLGGRLDSTNVLEPMISVITSIGYDHCEILGNSIKEIAREKAGIIKKFKPVVIGCLTKEARIEVESIARKKNAPLHFIEECKNNYPSTNLSGAFQRTNAAIASKTTELLNELLPVDRKTTMEALRQIYFPGRWQTLSVNPTLIVDACHNGHGAEAAEELWRSLPRRTEVWFASSGMNRVKEIIPILFEHFEKVNFIQLNQPRSCSFDDYKTMTADISGDINFYLEEAIPSLIDQLDSNASVLVTGSIYLVASVTKYFSAPSNSVRTKNWQDVW